MHIIRLFKEKISQSEFGKNVLILTGGTAIAQIIPFIFYPVIGRLYTPATFGLLATLTSITTLLVEVASGKYELSILITKTKKDAAHILGFVCLLSCCFLVCAYLILQFFFSDQLSNWLHEPNLKTWLFICPVSAFAIIIYNCYNEWCVRNKYFKNLSINKITNSGAITLNMLFFGFVKISGQGLVLGDTLGRIISAISCSYRALKFDKKEFINLSFRKMKILAKQYIEFPKYIMPSRLLNIIGLQLPIFIIGIYFNNTEVGYFSMTLLVFSVPINIISFAIRDVFRQRANEEYQAKGNCIEIYRKIFRLMSVLAFVGFISLVFILPFLFSAFLGNQWIMAGKYAQIICISILFSFIATPLSDIFIITHKKKINLYWQIYFVGITLLSLLLGAIVFNNMYMMLILFTIGRSTAYLLNIILSYHYAKGNLIKTEHL